jgi:hypothetical protein
VFIGFKDPSRSRRDKGQIRFGYGGAKIVLTNQQNHGSTKSQIEGKGNRGADAS